MVEECEVVDCKEEVFKSVSSSYAPLIQQLGLKVERRGKRIKLCKKHYKEIRKVKRKVKRAMF